mgnify:CR=1 FL=1
MIHQTNPSIEIVILTRDRPNYLKESLESVLSQTYSKNVNFRVSDNSDGTESMDMMAEYEIVRYIKRNPTLPGIEHFKTVIDESSCEYLVLFHDDDRMLPNFIESSLKYFAKYPDAVAIGSNARVINKDARLLRNSWLKRNHVKKYCEPVDLLLDYLPGSSGSSPFPSYIYKRNVISSEMISYHQGGKYSDVSFLANITRVGPIYSIPDVLMEYRVHSNNDSGHKSIEQYFTLWQFMIKENINRNNVIFKKWRMQEFARFYIQNNGQKGILKPIIPVGNRNIILHKTALWVSIKWSPKRYLFSLIMGWLLKSIYNNKQYNS